LVLIAFSFTLVIGMSRNTSMLIETTMWQNFGSLPSDCKNGWRNVQETDFEISRISRFRYRTRYFNDSGIIGSKEFVAENYQ
jgi:hypothetical protein